jgi:hypothetical protein
MARCARVPQQVSTSSVERVTTGGETYHPSSEPEFGLKGGLSKAVTED